MPSAPTRRVLLDIEQASDYLGRDVSFVRRLVQHREVRHYKIGSRLRFDPADLDAFLAMCRVEALSLSAGVAVSDCLDAAAEIIERQIGRLRRVVLKSGAATIEGVRRHHQPGAELRYEMLMVVTPGWVTAPSALPDHERKTGGDVSDDANVARMHRVLNPWLKATALAASSVAEVVRCDESREETARGLPPEYTVQIVVRVPTAARVGLTRTTRAVPEGVAGLPGVDHVQSAVNGEA